jgi:hypothetical protein
MAKVMQGGSGRIEFMCPGCKSIHSLTVEGEKHPKWSFNGDFDKPTFRPSILAKSGHYASHAKGDDCWCNSKERFPDEGEPPFKCSICHSFVTDGKIQFLSDCTHELAGQTVELNDIE